MKMPIIIVAVLSLFSSAAFGACWSLACRGPAVDLLEFVYVHENGNIYLKITDPDKGLLNCTLSENVYMTLEPTNLRQKEIYATLLTAISTKQNITLRVAEGTNNCSVKYLMMNTK